ncbi:MAG: helix-turn-helix transcriptional regulator [Alphaproteobacteria bacterium]|nr:helix-turn-helix transcriptional regulator [Alphaproteobacteria bacterium]MDE2492413.1 helix-turn-helix transcriptional regulator [Alphaproteobacteria bacterium]
MRSVETWKRRQLKNPVVKKEYGALEEEFALVHELIAARSSAKLSQAQVARRMGTSLATVIRMEGGRSPSLSSLTKYARAVGCKVEIKLV